MKDKTWYDDMERMEKENEYLQSIYRNSSLFSPSKTERG